MPCNDAVCKLLPDGQKQELAPCMNAVTPQRIVGTVVQYLTKADAS